MSEIDNMTKDEAIALIVELKKAKESLDIFEPIDTTIFDSIKRRNIIEKEDDQQK